MSETVHAVYGDRNFHEGERDGADYSISEIREVIGVMSDGVGENYEGLKKSHPVMDP